MTDDDLFSIIGAIVCLLLLAFLVGCVQGTPVGPEDVEPQQTKWGRTDSATITIRIPNPNLPDSAG